MDKALLKSAAASVLKSIMDRKKAQQAFVEGPTFARMISTLRDTSDARSVSSEQISYKMEETRTSLGWSFATEEDINLFMNVLGNPQASTIEGEVKSDETNQFYNASYRHYGLNVFFMTGQGTFVTVFNDTAKREIEASKVAEFSEEEPLGAFVGIEDRPHGQNSKQVIVMRTDLEMDLGKFVGQAMHAVVGAVMLGHVYDPVAKTVTFSVADPAFESWLLLASFKKIVCGVKSEAKLLALHEKAKAAGLRTVLIKDAGHTHFNNVPTHTGLCIGPHWPEEIDPVTKRLQLLKTPNGKLEFS